MITHTVIGSKYRVQFRIIDLTSDDTPASIMEVRPIFCVYILDASFNRFTSFSVAGKQVYCGDDPDAAYDTATRYLQGLSFKLPKRLMAYMVRWSKKINRIDVI